MRENEQLKKQFGYKSLESSGNVKPAQQVFRGYEEAAWLDAGDLDDLLEIAQSIESELSKNGDHTDARLALALVAAVKTFDHSRQIGNREAIKAAGSVLDQMLNKMREVRMES